MNVPYVKKYVNGELSNPIEKFYNSKEYDPQNRSERRSKPARFKGNGKNFSLTVYKTGKYLRRVVTITQPVLDAKNKPLLQTVENNHIKIKVINHYIAR